MSPPYIYIIIKNSLNYNNTILTCIKLRILYKYSIIHWPIHMVSVLLFSVKGMDRYNVFVPRLGKPFAEVT